MTATIDPSTEAKPGSPVRLAGLRRGYGQVTALDGLDLDIAPGELVSLLGPSGCGKTTALRIVAGLEHSDAGAVFVDGRDITKVPANKRDMAMVFQSYSLFPNLTAGENVAFGLRLRGVSPAARAKRAGELLELVGLNQHYDRYATQMSGGQQQRVALARALAIEPKVLLLDEPLSALDAKVRVQLRDEIRGLQQRLGITTLFVTHDQEEALSMSDRVAVMNAGRLEQCASPDEVYTRPATPFVAAFVGAMNRIPGIASGAEVEVLGQRLAVTQAPEVSAGSRITALVRPESVLLSPAIAGTVRVARSSFRGPVTRVTVELADGTEVDSDLPSSAAVDLRPGTLADIRFAPEPVMVIP
jgi:putative spermidine/putrescine transport system ATP-binding protein